MSSKLKALGLGILTVLAVGAFAAVNASAEPEEELGHFISDSPSERTVITGTEGGEHRTELVILGFPPIACDTLYEGTMEGNTDVELTITGIYETCHTTGSEQIIPVDLNGCDYLFTIGDHAEADNTIHLKCPEGEQIEITHLGCTIKIPEQTLKGASYTTDTATFNEEVKHTITLDLTVEKLTIHFEEGFCILFGTKLASELTGSLTVKGFEDLGIDAEHPHGVEGELVNITATGSLDE